jgi:hypothetical protein
MDHYSPIADSGPGPGAGRWRGFTSKATMFFRINRYENDSVPIADSSRRMACVTARAAGLRLMVGQMTPLTIPSSLPKTVELGLAGPGGMFLISIELGI